VKGKCKKVKKKKIEENTNQNSFPYPIVSVYSLFHEFLFAKPKKS